MREPKRHYHLYAKWIDYKQGDMNDLLKKYADNVEEMVKKYPLQWFNFYDFWNDKK